MIHRTLAPVLACTFLLFLAAASAALAQEPQPGKPIPLFNGKNLDGWVWVQREKEGEPKVAIDDVFTVKEGGILHDKGTPIGYIRTAKDYTNYKLTLEWRFPGKPGNGGVLLRMIGQDKVWPKSIEAQLQHQNAGDFWNIDEFPMTVAKERTKGRNTKKEHPSNEKPLGEWNRYEITVDGGRVELKVNGLVQNVATDCQVVPGKICLQAEGSEMEFRNIELTPLPGRGTTGAAASSGNAGGGEAKQLFNGKDLTGFAAFFEDANAKMQDVFVVKDGVIHCKGTPTGYLKTTDSYGDFVFAMEYRWPGKPGNSGLLLRAQPPDKIFPVSFEAQLKAGEAGASLPLQGFKANAKNGPLGKHEKRPGEWNAMEVRMQGGDAEVKLNGHVISTATDCQATPGFIAFQSEGVPIEFRNITVKPLGAAGGEKRSDAAPKRLRGLDGWHVTGNGNWTISDDGVIAGKQPASETSYTHVVSDKSYTDFRASLKFKCVAGNSGFYFRVKPEPGDRMVGIQAEIDEKSNVGGLYESYGRQWLSLPEPEVVAKYFKPQEWNEMTVEGHGPHVVVHVNGQKAGEINDPTIRMDGPFALQIHGGQDVHVMFKDIKIEDLSAGSGKSGAAGEKNSTFSLQRIATELYASLTPEQRKQATLPFDAPERTREEFTGGKRPGVHIKTLKPEQQKLAESLLTAFCSDYGKRKAIEIADQESNTADPATGFGRYWLCFFGEPGEGKTYAWRIAEHHLTIVHMEVEKGQPKSFGPILLGANPPVLWDAEEEKMLALYNAMTPDERSKSQAPGKGISTRGFDDRHGIRVGELNPSAKQAARDVLDNRLAFFAEPVAARVKKIIESEGGLDAMRIAFYGKVDKKCRDGGRWDFKLAGDTFLCDYEASRAHIHLSMKGTLAQAK